LVNLVNDLVLLWNLEFDQQKKDYASRTGGSLLKMINEN
jgi:hypothetical protein